MFKRPALIALALMLASPAAAQDMPPAHDAENGQDLYMRYCATCHGADARGIGPMASVLTVQPTDLTRLASRNDDVFPMLRAVMRIDGRDALTAHGSPMLIYGWFFEGESAALRTADNQNIVTSQPIADLVAWLQTIQE